MGDGSGIPNERGGSFVRVSRGRALRRGMAALALVALGFGSANAAATNQSELGRSPALAVAECVSTDMMFVGMPGPDPEVALLQTRLVELGFDPGEVDGYFGQNTMAATAASQAAYSDGTSGGNGIFVDEGTVLGPEVFERLGIACGSGTTPPATVAPAPDGAVLSTERVRFDPGTSGATVDGGAAPGAGVRYLLEASAGQWMSVSLSAAGTAAFTVSAPDGSNLSGPPAQTWAGALPANGDYAVDVTTSVPTNFTIVFSITAGPPATPPATQPATPPATPPATNNSPLPAGATLQNPVLLTRGDESILTDGRHELTPLPGRVVRQATAEPDGMIVLLADDIVATVTPDGAVRSAACPGCRGLAVSGDRIVLARDPGVDATFEFVSFNRSDLSGAGNVTAPRVVDPNPYPDGDRQYWDTPLVLFADDAGTVVTYDYQPGGYNARGGGDTVVARYSMAGELGESTRLVGRVDDGVVSPDRRFAALVLGGSFGACYTVGDVGVVDLTTLSVSFPEVAGGDDGTTWFQLNPYWDADGVLRALGERFHEPPVDLDDEYCQITIEPWEHRYDPASGVWTEQPATGITRWIGPACTDVLALDVIPGPDEDGPGGVHVRATLDGSTRDLGASGWVRLGRAAAPDCS